MPSLIEGDDRQTVKRTVPKTSNKIHAVAVARLYVAYPDRQRWTYTGLQGAAVLANDLVGHTYWIKLVDISPANRGVIWDQELYDIFSYNQDRTFFHTFELEGCLAGLSFADDKEAKKFKQKVDEREKNAHKTTKAKAFGNSAAQADTHTSNGKSHSRLGGIGNLLHGYRHSSAQQQPPAQSILPRKAASVASPTYDNKSRERLVDKIDPAILDELLAMGVTEDQLADHADFIESYIREKKAAADVNDRRQEAPQPAKPISPQITGSSVNSKRGPPPALPPARRRGPDSSRRPGSPSERESSPPPGPSGLKFRAPPPFADAGRFAHDLSPPSLPSRPRESSSAANSSPAPPPRPPKTPLEEQGAPSPKFVEPAPSPSFQRQHLAPAPPSRSGAPPPPPPGRNSVPTPPPSRDTSVTEYIFPAAVPHAPLPFRPGNVTSSAAVIPPPPPPPPGRDNRTISPSSPVGNAPRANISSSVPPPAPPMPSIGMPPPPPPPPAPLPMLASAAGGTPAPPLPPGMEPVTANNPPMAAAIQGRGGLLAEIQGGARLKKVSAQEKRDRSAAVATGEHASAGGNPNPAPGAGGADTGLAGALASALAARKSKVSASDDEDDKDDW